MKTDYSIYILSKREKTGFILAGYATAFAVTYLFYHSIVFSCAAGIIPVFFTESYSRYLAEKRKTELLMQFKDFLYALSSSMSAGRQLLSALKDSAAGLSLMYDEKSPLIQELRFMVRNIEENRESEDKLLLNFSQRSHLEDIVNFAEVFSICRKTGGDINKVIKNTSDILLDKMTIQKEIKTITAQKKLEGRIIALMPLIVILGLEISSPDYLEVLYTTVAGRLIMTAALLGICIAWFLSERISSIEI